MFFFSPFCLSSTFIVLHCNVYIAYPKRAMIERSPLEQLNMQFLIGFLLVFLGLFNFLFLMENPNGNFVFQISLGLGLFNFASSAMAKTHYHDFVVSFLSYDWINTSTVNIFNLFHAIIWFMQIKEAPYTRLCHTKKILTVNGQFPGPTIYARKGDTVIVEAHNQGDYNITLHWYVHLVQ